MYINIQNIEYKYINRYKIKFVKNNPKFHNLRLFLTNFMTIYISTYLYIYNISYT